MSDFDSHAAIEWLLSWADKWERVHGRGKDANMAQTIADYLLEIEVDRKAAAMERQRA